MKETDVHELINESIQLELRMANLYKIYSTEFTEDRGFWWQLVIEEQGHAALLRSGRDHFLPADTFPETLVDPSLINLRRSNNMAASFLKRINASIPDKETAYSAAYHFENLVGEFTFQMFMAKNANSRLEEVFQQLNKDSVDHAERILSHMKENGTVLLGSEESFTAKGSF